MQKIVLFNGGREGGILLGENSSKSIPPFNLAIQKQLKAVAELTQAIYLDGSIDREERYLSGLVVRVANIVVDEIESVVGPLGADYSLVYQDADGGFTCGANGKSPLPIAWPPEKAPSLDTLISKGLIESEMISYFEKASEAKIAVKDMLEAPENYSRKMGIKLSEKTATNIKNIAPSNIDKIKNKEDKEVIGFLHKVIEDGRYINQWMTKPYDTAKALKLKLSDKAYEKILVGIEGIKNPIEQKGFLGVVLAIIIMQASSKPQGTHLITDLSGKRKF